jgi:alkylhydroperoxidase family enzyme
MRDYVEELRPHDRVPGEEATPVAAQAVLLRTRHNLQRQMEQFRPSEVFEEDGDMKNGVGLVKYMRDYIAEEDERREHTAVTAWRYAKA